jgi:hypothetical protein
MNNIKNKKISLTSYTKEHDGKEGHWLEKKMGLKPNCYTEPDILGYEMKKSATKITFGDFSATEYLFTNGGITRKEFITYFGEPNPLKENRYSWSGRCFPIYKKWNDCGQMIHLKNKDLCIYYSYEKDKRERKLDFPDFLKGKKITIAKWNGEILKSKIDRKFNKKGFFICKKKKGENKGEKTYNKICFGKPFSYDFFLTYFKKREIFLDSGMYDGNRRNYSHFRGRSSFWDTLITDEY